MNFGLQVSNQLFVFAAGFGPLGWYFSGEAWKIRRQLLVQVLICLGFIKSGLCLFYRRFGEKGLLSPGRLNELLLPWNSQSLFQIFHLGVVRTLNSVIIKRVIILILYIDNFKLHSHLESTLPTPALCHSVVLESPFSIVCESAPYYFFLPILTLHCHHYRQLNKHQNLPCCRSQTQSFQLSGSAQCWSLSRHSQAICTQCSPLLLALNY